MFHSPDKSSMMRTTVQHREVSTQLKTVTLPTVNLNLSSCPIANLALPQVPNTSLSLDSLMSYHSSLTRREKNIVMPLLLILLRSWIYFMALYRQFSTFGCGIFMRNSVGCRAEAIVRFIRNTSYCCFSWLLSLLQECKGNADIKSTISKNIPRRIHWNHSIHDFRT